MAEPRLDPPVAVTEIAARLEQAGYETWCVGGAVRDALLGQRHLDWDLATAATPPQVRRLFRRTVPVGEAFGTIGVLDADGHMHEVTTFRHDVKTDGRHAEVEFGASLDEDLARRDFTINAMAWSPSRGQLHDPFGGRADLARRVVRAVGDAPTRMAEDRLRALRAIRFAARFNFAIEPATWAALVASAPALHRLSRERIQQELVKTLEQVRRPGDALRLWDACGALAALLPPLAGRAEWQYRAADRRALPDDASHDHVARRRVLVRLGAVVAGLAPEVVRSLLTGLRFASRDVQRTARLVEVAGVIASGLEGGHEVGDATFRRWAAAAHRPDTADAMRIAISVLQARGGTPPGVSERWGRDYRRAVRVAFRDPVALADLAVDGEDLVRVGVGAGPAVGAMLRRLLDHVLEHPEANQVEALLGLAREWQDSR